jgi:hypothetical protein
MVADVVDVGAEAGWIHRTEISIETEIVINCNTLGVMIENRMTLVVVKNFVPAGTF